MAENENLVASLDALVEKHHLLRHPFYRAWTEGRLSKETLALYAGQYYAHVRAFPENLAILARRADDTLAPLVRENLAEELDPAAPHPKLWRQFAQALGVSESALDSARPRPGIAGLLGAYREISEEGSLAEAVAAFYAYEAQVPEIAGEKIRGLRSFYGITDSRALAYFAVHQEADVRHRAAWRDWLASAEIMDSAAVLRAAERALTALWGALGAVCPEGFTSAAPN